jgi:AP2-like factor, ANT lineage
MAVTNFEPNRYNLEAILQRGLPVIGPGKRLNQKPASETQGQGTLIAPYSFSQQSNNNNLLPHYLPNLPQPQPALPPQPLPPLDFNYVYQPNFYWPYSTVEQKVLLESKEKMVNGLLEQASSTAN